MSATKPAELTLAIQKATEGFTVIVDRPTDNDLIEIRQLLVPILMKTTYDELTLQHNLAGVILPTERYEHIYRKGAYAIPPVIPLYDDNIVSRTLVKLTCYVEEHCSLGGSIISSLDNGAFVGLI